MAKQKQKLKWTDTEEIAFRLIDQYPKQDPLRVKFTELHRYVTSLPDFMDNPKKSTESLLESIQMRWYEERQEMDDELGPVDGGPSDDDDEVLDEDDYRDDKDADDEDLSTDVEDDEDDEFGDGFQEEDGDER